jgi:hypothetical protein
MVDDKRKSQYADIRNIERGDWDSDLLTNHIGKAVENVMALMHAASIEEGQHDMATSLAASLPHLIRALKLSEEANG